MTVSNRGDLASARRRGFAGRCRKPVAGAALVLTLLCSMAVTGRATVASAQDAGSGSLPEIESVPQPLRQAPELAPVPQPEAGQLPPMGAEAPQTAPSGAAAPIAPASAAPLPAVEEGSAAAGEARLLPSNLSPWGMFVHADMVVKTVMIGLALASFLTWTIWLAKTVEIAGAKSRLRSCLRKLAAARSLDEAAAALAGRRGPVPMLVAAAAEEVQASSFAPDHISAEGIKERVASRLSRLEAAAGRRLSAGTGFLATIGSTAPFVGLFGTVWGIMNSFIGISEAQTTNLAVVAPGIAEALLATAMGLIAAIPAVVIYNVFARSIAGYKQLLADAGAGVERLVSRDLDFARAPQAARKPRAAAAE